MGGGAILPAMEGGYGGGGGATVTKPWNILNNYQQFQSDQRPLVISRLPIRPPVTENGGLAEACGEKLHGNYEEIEKKWCFDYGFGSNPSKIEVERALSQLQRYMDSRRPEYCEGLHQVFSVTDSRMVQYPPSYGRLNRAYGLFEKDPSMQSMVMSISCDKAVWDAIINNKSVQDLQGSLATAKQEQADINTTERDLVNLIVKWIMGLTKSTIAEKVEKFMMLVGEIFIPGEKEKPTSELTDLVEEKIRSSLLLSVVILLIVIVTRNNEA